MERKREPCMATRNVLYIPLQTLSCDCDAVFATYFLFMWRQRVRGKDHSREKYGKGDPPYCTQDVANQLIARSSGPDHREPLLLCQHQISVPCVGVNTTPFQSYDHKPRCLQIVSSFSLKYPARSNGLVQNTGRMLRAKYRSNGSNESDSSAQTHIEWTVEG